MQWRFAGVKAPDADQMRQRLTERYEQFAGALAEQPELERSTREQFNLVVDSITGLIESGALGPGPFIVTLTGNATAGHQPYPGEQQHLQLSVSGAQPTSNAQPGIAALSGARQEGT